MRRSTTPAATQAPAPASRRPASAPLPTRPRPTPATRPTPARDAASRVPANPACRRSEPAKVKTGSSASAADRKPLPATAAVRTSAPPPPRAAAVKAAATPAAAAGVGVAAKSPMPCPPRKRSRVETPSPVPRLPATSTPVSSAATRGRRRVISGLTRGGYQPVNGKPSAEDSGKKKQQAPAPPPQARRPPLVPVASPASAAPARTLRLRRPQPAAVAGSRKKSPAATRNSLRGRPPTPRHAASSAGGGAGGGAGPKGEPSGPSMVDVEGGALALQQQQQQQQQLQQQQQQLAAQYQQVVSEKARLEARLAELLDAEQEVHTLRDKIQEQHSTMEQLRAENVSLQAKLLSVAHSPLSDSEKQQLLLGARQHSSAPASMVASDLQLPVDDTADTIADTSIQPWDRQSASSASQLSVACLQDRIQKMEETHYSTSEELQATIQELADLQSQLQELQAENERLVEDKHILVEYLCQQSEKLEDSRSQAEALQGMLLRGGPGEVVHDDRLLDLLKIAQEKRDCLLVKQQELSAEVAELRQATNDAQEEAAQSRESIRKLEATLEAVQAERHSLERELAEVRQESSSRLIELQRLTTLLENARAKIEELETARELEDKSDVEEMLDNVRKEKDTLESQVAALQEQVLRGQCEITRLEEQLMHLQEECKVTRNNAKSALSDLEYKFESLKQEKQQLSTEVQVLQKSLSDLKMQCQCYLDDKEQLEAVLADSQKHLNEAEQKLSEQEKSLEEERRLRQQENEEWQQFQTDLLTTVRVANDFKTEASEELKKLLVENKNLRDKVRNIEAQLEKYKAATPKPPASATLGIRVPASAMQETGCPTSTLTNSVPQEITLRGKGIGVSRQDSQISVKSLIESIENATKQTKGGPRSRSSSTSSLSSITSEVRNATSTSNPSMPQTPNFTRRHNSETDAVFSVKAPLRDQQQSNNQSAGNNTNNMKASQNRRNLITDNTNSKANLYNDSFKNNKPLGDVVQASPVSILANKTMDFVRRNSYSDLSERKDPLSALTKNGGSKRNALLKWCQNKTVGYKNIDITNFSSSWNDGLAFCAILHSYLPDKVPYDTLNPSEKRRNFSIAFAAAESVGILTTLNLSEMIQLERPDWQQVMAYVTAIYKHFET